MIPYDRRDWFHLLFSARGNLTGGVLVRVLTFGALGLAVWLIDRLDNYSLQIPTGFHEVAGVVIGLILAFRTNTAYARFWEGRTLWGGIVNASRNLARVVETHAELSAAEAREFGVWIAVFACSTRSRLRGMPNVPEAEGWLSSEDYQQFAAAPHPALFASEKLSAQMTNLAAQGRLDPIMAGVAEEQLVALINCLGGCERIVRTPTPLGYILLMERGAFLYIGTLPFALVGRLGWLEPLVTVGVAYLVLMIEALGNELDNPFGTDASDIPLDQICSNIAFDLMGVGPKPKYGPEKGIGPVLR
jgi:putative membrane protein